jgi:16S rRNA (guanine(966)-N(2))-methyltransferase RsmD
MRIGSGTMRGRRLKAPRGDRTRPTGGRLKKSLFDVLGPRLSGSRVLDLYAGAGSLGLEALSRGALSAVLVDRNRKACEAIRANVFELALAGSVEVVQKEAESALSSLKRRGERFDVVFADPPYRSAAADEVIELLGDSDVVAPGGVVALEHHHKRELRERYGCLARIRVLKAGESAVTLYQRAG